MKKVALSGKELFKRLSDPAWWSVLELDVPAIVKSVYEADCRGDELSDELLSEAAAAERAAYEKYAASWFVVSWPDHVLTPKFNGDASYSCPMTKEEAREYADCEYID